MSLYNFCPYLDRMGGTGIWYRLQNIHHRRTGHPLRYPHKLGTRADCLDRHIFLEIGRFGVDMPGRLC